MLEVIESCNDSEHAFRRQQGFAQLHGWSAGLLWFNRAGLGIWSLSHADAGPSLPSHAAESTLQQSQPRTLGLVDMTSGAVHLPR